MPIRIKQLRCKVTVKTASAKSPLHKDEKAPRPEMLFALPQGASAMETAPSPGETATEERDAQKQSGGTRSPAEPRRADPKQVADRVYELMRDEIRLTRLRGG